MTTNLDQYKNDKVVFVDEPGKASLHYKGEPKALKPDEVRIEAIYTCLCGSDLHTFRGRHPSVSLPATIGHEMVGYIREVGSEVKNLHVGQRVVVEPLQVCGTCSACLQGKYSYCEDMKLQYRIGNGFLCKYVAVPARFTYPVPDELDDESAALCEVLAIAVRGVRRAHVHMDEDVLITGAGTVGLLAAAVCSKIGARKIIIADRIEQKLELAKELGATHTINTTVDNIQEKVRKICPLGTDKALECVGLEATLVDCLQSVKRGGTVTQVGIFEKKELTLPAPIFITRELTLTGCQSYNFDFEAAIDLACKIDLKKLVTHKYPLTEIQQAFDTFNDPHSGAIKVLLYPDW